jgi:uncharacterized protein
MTRYSAPLGIAVLAAGLLAGCSGDSLEFGSDGQSGWTTLGTRAKEAAPAPMPAANGAWPEYDPPAEWADTVSHRDEITLDDGTVLAVTVVLPADAEGNAGAGPFPTVLTLTGYNKLAGSFVPAIGGGNPLFLSHGYAHVIVDVRGTGASDGQWEAFGETEQGDYRPIVEWVATQPFCDGNIGLYGVSLLGITATLTAAQQHPAVKALFPIVPLADGYRDIVFTGGQVNVGFIPLWLGLVTGLSVLDPTLLLDPVTGLQHTVDRVLNAVTNFQVPTILRAVVGDPDTAYDGDFWKVRSPLEQADNIRVPTFVVGGLKDIFQRGEPLLYEQLKHHTTAKLLMGPWNHIEAAGGLGLPADGVPPIDRIALQWFDRYLKGLPTGAEALPNVTQFVYGHEHYVTAADWPHPQARAERLYLRGDRALTADQPAADEAGNVVLQQPLNGVCSASTAQWTAGLVGLLPLPCFEEDNLATLLDARFDTPPMTAPMWVSGPIQADLWISTTALNAGVSVRVADVAPDGSARALTNGLLTASFRAVDASRSRYLDGEMIQPWHPFTAESEQTVTPGEPMLLQVEVFPSSFMIAEGHRLRISVGPSDIPHGLPPLPDLIPGLLGAMTILSDEAHPSSVVLPVVPGTP